MKKSAIFKNKYTSGPIVKSLISLTVPVVGSQHFTNTLSTYKYILGG
ncbi:MAG: hypothetical protein ABH812_01035 [bacterium]